MKKKTGYTLLDKNLLRNSGRNWSILSFEKSLESEENSSENRMKAMLLNKINLNNDLQNFKPVKIKKTFASQTSAKNLFNSVFIKSPKNLRIHSPRESISAKLEIAYKNDNYSTTHESKKLQNKDTQLSRYKISGSFLQKLPSKEFIKATSKMPLLSYKQSKQKSISDSLLKSALSRTLVKTENSQSKRSLIKSESNESLDKKPSKKYLKKYPQFTIKWYDLKKVECASKYMRKNFLLSYAPNPNKKRFTAKDIIKNTNPNTVNSFENIESPRTFLPPQILKIPISSINCIMELPVTQQIENDTDWDEENSLLKLLENRPNYTELAKKQSEPNRQKQIKMLNEINAKLNNLRYESEVFFKKIVINK